MRIFLNYAHPRIGPVGLVASAKLSKRTRHAVYSITFHFVWTSKHRRPVLVDGILKRLEELICRETKEIDGEVIELVVQQDRVRLPGSFAPTIASYQIMYRIRDYTAHLLPREFPHLNSRLPNLWTRLNCVGTAGRVSARVIERTIEAQRRS